MSKAWRSMAKKRIYRVVFHSHGKIYELYARSVGHGELYGFVEIGEIIFGERTAILVDPSEEKLKSEFEGVQRTYVPFHAVVRIDEVRREGNNKIIEAGEGGNVTPFPIPMYPTSGDRP